MVFSSPLFIFGFFPVFFLVYYIVPSKLKNWVALGGSILYYFWGAPEFVFVVAASLVIDWVIGNRIHDCANPHRQRVLLAVAVVLNVGLLGYFKYANFFVRNIYGVLDSLQLQHGGWMDVALPIGVSFIVFEKITYLVDIYRKESLPAKKLEHYFLYIFLFPHLVSGPIIQYHDLAPRLVDRRHDYEGFRDGLFRFSRGLVKKVWIADLVAQIADPVFSTPPAHLSCSAAWLGVLAYALQIYFDFSGYADMAIGMMRLMGFTIPENFNLPYLSKSITEFWRRWHMSLGRFMKAYLYIPLGGSRVPAWRAYANLVIVFTISGIWHGANWTFLVWGIYHGCFLVLDRIYWLRASSRLPAWFSTVVTFCAVCLGWVLFRSPSINYAADLYYTLIDFSRWTAFYPDAELIIRPQVWLAFVIGYAVVFAPAFLKSLRDSFNKGLPVRSADRFAAEAATVVFLVLALSRAGVSEFSPFIYFRF
jgi:alginate O-acetyltransferase complex protein AlgI